MNLRGFTLLEVMIAVAILGLALTAIFSSEVGASNVAQRAKRQNVATTLARCKMGEIEEVIAIEGLPLVDKADDDNCCEHAPVEGYECSWIVERIILPELGADEDSDDELSEKDRNNQRLNETYESITEQGGTPETVVAGEAGNLALMALQIGFPILKPFLEEQVRRATVSVRWKEGDKDRGFDVIQFLVSEQPARAEEPTTTEEGS
ncbi:MAG: type II secretion system GspH family protein [Myxococcales bacterium]|nr:type II secretion system GspH family protein [Myxococcales bacterium]MDH3485509.1 type II secretion system GspH family protein [Myxococcales bacterium]